MVITKCGRKYPYVICITIAGISCVAIYFTRNYTFTFFVLKKKRLKNCVFIILLENAVVLTVVLAMIGKFAVSITYAVIHLYSSEIFPTTIRGSCQGAW
jgi:hypothetical protein